MVADICIYIYIDLYYLVFSSPRPLVTSLRHGPLGGHSPWRIGGWSEEQPPLEPPSVVVIMEFMVIIMILVAVLVIVVVVLVLTYIYIHVFLLFFFFFVFAVVVSSPRPPVIPLRDGCTGKH